jgi:hypothetical protein
LVVLSDIEMGAGGAEDDFPQTDDLGDLLLAYNEPPFRDVPLTVVFNGDTFDLLKTSLDGTYPTRITAEIAAAKLQRIKAAHRGFFERLQRLLAHDAGSRQLCFLPGNHDLELVFPEVQALLRGWCGDSGQLLFPGHAYRVGQVEIEHGTRGDPLFAVDEHAPFVSDKGELLLNLPWGTVALLEVAVPFSPIFYAVNRLKPRSAVLDQLPEVRDLLLGGFWRYWTRDYWRDYFADADPMKQLSWTMLRETVYRLSTGDADVSMGDYYQRRLANDDSLRLILVGHQHEPVWWSRGDRKVLRTGCFRNELTLGPKGVGYRQLPNVYAEVYLRGDKPLRSHLVEVDAPPLPADYMPASLHQVRAKAKALLERERHDVERDRAAQAKQEAKETDESADLEQEHGFAFLRSLRQALTRKRDE